jgi:hypothetical protein
MLLEPHKLNEILSLLAEHLKLQTDEQWNIVVCGGSALNALNLVCRTTKDIDVLGRLENERIVHAAFDSLFWDVVLEVGEYFDLPKDWLNTGPESYLETGLPEGLAERLVWKSYGESLNIGYLSRIDQVFFKVYASADRGGYHVDDLLKLQPTLEEIYHAGLWCKKQDGSEGFSMILSSMLEQIGFPDVAKKLNS